MDHFYQQKLINEKNHLQRQLVEAERKLKTLSEQVGEYELVISFLNEGAAERANDAGLARLQRKSGIDLGVKTTHSEGEGITPAGKAAEQRRMRQQEIGMDNIKQQIKEGVFGDLFQKMKNKLRGGRFETNQQSRQRRQARWDAEDRPAKEAEEARWKAREEEGRRWSAGSTERLAGYKARDEHEKWRSAQHNKLGHDYSGGSHNRS